MHKWAYLPTSVVWMPFPTSTWFLDRKHQLFHHLGLWEMSTCSMISYAFPPFFSALLLFTSKAQRMFSKAATICSITSRLQFSKFIKSKTLTICKALICRAFSILSKIRENFWQLFSLKTQILLLGHTFKHDWIR